MESVNIIDRGGLNGIRVPEENILRFSRNVPEVNPEKEKHFESLKPNQVKTVTFGKSMDSKPDENPGESEREPETPAVDVSEQLGSVEQRNLKDQPRVDESIWTKIQSWFKNHTKLVTIIAVIIAILIVVVATYTLYFRKSPSVNPISRQSALNQMSNFRTGESLIHRNKEL